MFPAFFRLPVFIIVITTCTVSCVPMVFNESVMSSAWVNLPPYGQLRYDPLAYEGVLFVFGGIIADCRVTDRGSEIEAAFIPVNPGGYPLGVSSPTFRYRAFLHPDRGTLDPMVFTRGRYVSIAGIFLRLETGTFGNADYPFPLFEIWDIVLWPVPYYYQGYRYVW